MCRLASAAVIVSMAIWSGVPKRRNAFSTAVEITRMSAPICAARTADAKSLSITAVEKAFLRFGTPDQMAIDTMTAAEARRHIAEGHFAPGSMLPKVEACVHFVEKGGGTAVITCPACLSAALDGRTGTRVTR